MNQPVQPTMYYGQDAAEQARNMLPGFTNVRQTFLLYDTIRIGLDVPTNVSGWFTDFTTMLNSAGNYSFFDQRQEAETTTAYTNMKKKTGLDWPVIFTDLGIEFEYPDPVNVDMFDGDRTAGKQFSDFIKKNSYCELFVGGADDKLLTFKPEHAPYGFGTVGHQAGGTTVSYSSILSNGDALAGNRLQFKDWALALPKDYSLHVRLTLAKAARDMLALMAQVQPIVFANGTFNNEAQIKICFRGMRDIQQVGNFVR